MLKICVTVTIGVTMGFGIIREEVMLIKGIITVQPYVKYNK